MVLRCDHASLSLLLSHHDVEDCEASAPDGRSVILLLCGKPKEKRGTSNQRPTYLEQT
jgi:hypothetical protein